MESLVVGKFVDEKFVVGRLRVAKFGSSEVAKLEITKLKFGKFEVLPLAFSISKFAEKRCHSTDYHGRSCQKHFRVDRFPGV